MSDLGESALILRAGL